MLQGPAAYLSAPVYGHSHYKKFWLKKMETEESSAVQSAPPLAEGGGGVVLTKKLPLYAVNCSSLEIKGTSPLTVDIRAAALAPATIPTPTPTPTPSPSPSPSLSLVRKQIKYAVQESELGHTLALGEEDIGFSSRAEKFDKFAVNKLSSMEEEAQPSIYLNINNNGISSRAVMKMCADCKTVKTPLWRNGPQGPKSLCNACGIRYKKMGKRPSSNGERPSSPSTTPISPSGKNKIHGKRKRERNIYSRQQRKKIKNLGGGRSSMGRKCLQSEGDIAAYGGGGEGNRSGEALRRWRQVERIRKGLLRIGKMRNSMAKDEEEGAVLLMALSCGVASASASC